MTGPHDDALRRYRALATADLQAPDGDPRATLQVIVRFLAETLPVDGGASVLLWDQERDTFTTSASTVSGQEAADAAERIRPDGATRAIVDRREPVVVADTARTPFSADPMRDEYGIRAYVGVPLVTGHETVGVMYAMHRSPRAWTEDDVAYLRAVGMRAALAITRVHAVRLEELALERAQAMYAMSRHLMEADDTRELARRLVDGLADGLHAEAVMLLGLHGDGSALPARTVAGPRADVLADVPVDRLQQLGGSRLWDAAGPLDHTHPKLADLASHLDARHYLLTPLAAHGVLHGLLVVAALPGASAYTQRDAGFVQAMVNLVTVAVENLALVLELHKRASTDVLTGLYNRRHLIDLGEQLLAVARRTDEPLSVLMLDIDHFKVVNDEHGHTIGDEVLTQVATVLTDSLRDADVLGRYGGEEFAAILPNTPADVAFEVAERLRAAIAEEPVQTQAGPVDIRISVGGAVADLEDEPTLGGLLDRADERLYLAKRSGRNRVRFD